MYSNTLKLKDTTQKMMKVDDQSKFTLCFEGHYRRNCSFRHFSNFFSKQPSSS